MLPPITRPLPPNSGAGKTRVSDVVFHTTTPSTARACPARTLRRVTKMPWFSLVVNATHAERQRAGRHDQQHHERDHRLEQTEAGLSRLEPRNV